MMNLQHMTSPMSQTMAVRKYRFPVRWPHRILCMCMVVFKPLLYLLHDEFAAYDEPYVANDGGQEVSVPCPVAP